MTPRCDLTPPHRTPPSIQRTRPYLASHLSPSIDADLGWKQISTWAGHGDVRQTWNRYDDLVPGGQEQARERLDSLLGQTALVGS
jgi:hypothetical protein